MIKELLIKIISMRQDSVEYCILAGVYMVRDEETWQNTSWSLEVYTFNKYSIVLVLPKPPATTITCLHLIHSVDLLNPFQIYAPIGIVYH